jgi:DNA-directed RNA polymerase subunit RPC12/RpoP
MKYGNAYKCYTCGAEIRLLTPRGKKKEIACTNCWEVERRIEQYLKSRPGRDFIRKEFKEALKNARRNKDNVK